MTQPVLGILTLYLNKYGALEERPIYQKMTEAGLKLGLAIVVFTPEDVNFTKNLIYAHIYNIDSKSWSRKWMAIPKVIFDRCRIQRSHRYQLLLKFRARYRKLTFLNRPLRNKWTIHNVLSKDERFSPYLPKTRFISNTRDITEMLRKYSLIYLKPINGTGGRGILQIERLRDGMVQVRGREQSRRIISPRQLKLEHLPHYLNRWNVNNSNYIAQQGIRLKLHNGRVHDYRMLIQKNGKGEWKMTGCAGRIGAPGSITSNLHGGGVAVSMDTLLKGWIKDDAKIPQIRAEAETFGINAAAYLELCYDSLCELAFDIAIDRNGHIWMIEVNPKPAREVFIRAGEVEVYKNAIVKPLEYALWKIKQKKQ